MKKPFEEKESHKHRLAKELLASWFKNVEKTNDFCQVAQFSWRANYGVFTELKFYETSNPYYFELSGGLKEENGIIDKSIPNENRKDDFDPYFNKGEILFVPDITIFHKGTAAILIEVIHKNPLTEKKISTIRKFFSGHHIEVYEIEAEEILRQTNIPRHLITRQVI